MDTTTVLLGVLLVAATAVCAVVVWALRELVLTARSLRQLSDDARTRLFPIAEKVDVTIDAVNAELLRMDGVITRFEDASERIVRTTSAVNDIVNAPAGIVSDVADRVRRAWKDRKGV